MDEQHDFRQSLFYRFSTLLGLLALAAMLGTLVAWSYFGRASREVVGLALITVVLAALYLAPRVDDLIEAARGRAFRRGGNATVMSLGVIGILLIVNLYAARHSRQLDLTAAKLYTLSDQTNKIVRQLDQTNRDVRITAFFVGRDTFAEGARRLLETYKRQSPRILLEFVDPEVEPGRAQAAGIRTYPITLFQSGDRKEEVTGLTEQDFTSALLKLIKQEKKKVYFLTGHQERDVDSAARDGISGFSEALKRENYVVDKLSLLATPQVPADAAAVVVAGPRSPLLEHEKQAVDDYVTSGGRLLVLVETGSDNGLNEILEKWWMRVEPDLVIEAGPRAFLGDVTAPAPLPQAGHRITGSGLPDSVLPGARSVTIKTGAPEDFALAPLLRTTPQAWGETNPQPPFRYDEAQDRRGPLNLAVAVNRLEKTQATPTPGTPAPKPKSLGRLVVVGNATFATNNLFAQIPGNGDFLVNSVNWLAEEEELISIRATPPEAPPVVLTGQAQTLVFYISVVFVPLAVLLIGASIWWQRR